MVKPPCNSTSTFAANHPNYVGLPGEAVPGNTATPTEQRIFEKIVLIPAAIPLIFLGAKAAFFAGIAALVARCGSTGEIEAPIMWTAPGERIDDRTGDGYSLEDSGTVAEDSGTVAEDSGTAAEDGGTAAEDSGTAAEDGGTAADETEVFGEKVICLPAPGSVIKKDDQGNPYIEIIVNEGEIATTSFCFSAEYYTCDTPAVSAQQLPAGLTCYDFKYPSDKTNLFTKTCTAYADSIFTQQNCPPLKVVVNKAPVITGVNPNNPALPNGNKQYINGNFFTVLATSKDPNNDPTRCTITAKTLKGLPPLSASDDFTTNELHVVQLPAEKFVPFGKFPGSVTCVDDKGGTSSESKFTLLTTDASAVLYLPADENNGKFVFDASGNGLNGELMGGVKWTNGVNGSAIHLQFQGHYVEFPYSSLLNFGSGPFTIATWLFLHPSNEARAIFENGATTGYKLYFLKDTSVAFYSYDCFTVASGPGPVVGKWGHVAVTRNNTNSIHTYVNGALVGSDFCDDNYTNNMKLWIGCDEPVTGCVQPLYGLVDEVVFAKRALSGAEILTQCNLNDPTGTTCINP